MDIRKDQGREYAQGAMMSPNPEPEMITMDEAVGIPMPGGPTKRPVSPLQESLARLRRDTRAMISIGVLAFLVLVALIGPSIYTHIGAPFVSSVTNQSIGPQDYHGYTHEELENQDQGPSAMYWLGTDNLGRDELARLMQGLLVSLFVAVFVEIFDITLGLLVGVLAGYYGGIIDQFLARFTDLMLAFPGLLLIILVAGIFGPSADTAFAHIPILGANGNARLLLVGIVIAVTAWPLMARVVRGQTLQLKEQQFVEAARTSGTTNTRIIMRHIIPNLFSVVIIVATLDISVTIISEAGISVLGLGVQAPGSSIGLMISEAQNYISTHPWEELLPCIALIIIVLCFSFIGDGVRDAFDPRSKD
ncbi:MAG TPA: ABC transporter permease [Ktedonobacteraceae bacterium]|jgi:oligopeptide transport system permease protein|nr:ABC transporter permease [Ktedonobacteraceae bacterium]